MNRTAIIVELFTRCRTARPTIEWDEGAPGADPPREMVWLSNIEGDLDIPVINALPLTIEDEATATVTARSATGGLSRSAAMTNVEAYLTDVVTVLATAPTLGNTFADLISITPGGYRGPFSYPNPGERGFMAVGELDIKIHSRP